MAPEAVVRVERLRFAFPTPAFPAYAVVVALQVEGPTDLKLTELEFDGTRTRDVLLLQDSRELPDRRLRPGRVEVMGRAPWRNGQRHRVRLYGVTASGTSWSSEPVEADAPSYGGYWDPAWPYYAGVVVTETAGVARHRHPVQVTLALYGDRLVESRHVRVVAIDPQTGFPTPVVAQVVNYDVWEDPELIRREPYRYQPTATLQLLFLADVPALGQRVYLVFYGNPKAAPEPATDLTVVRRADGRIAEVENSYYRVTLHEKSGLIDAIHIKQGVDTTLAHGLEPPGTVHWNPDCYAPPKPWSHVSDWDPPAHWKESVGPLAVVVSAWGPMPFGVDEVEASVTYTFYAGVPYFTASTTLRVVRPIAVQALRMGEMVFNKDVVDHFAWRDARGQVQSFCIHEVRQHPQPAVILPADTAWVAMYGKAERCGVAGLTLDFVAERFGDGLPVTEQPHMYVEIGPWAYWCRSIINTFVSNNPTRLIRVPAGTINVERNAYLPFAFAQAPETAFDWIDQHYRQLVSPLLVRVQLDTDPRVPDKWVPPVLAQPFQELPPEEIFRPEPGR